MLNNIFLTFVINYLNYLAILKLNKNILLIIIKCITWLVDTIDSLLKYNNT